MKIGKINSNTYYHPVINRAVSNFKGGYKDLKTEEEKFVFDKTLEYSAALYKTLSEYKERTIDLNGEKLILSSDNDGFYMLKSQNGDIRATMTTMKRECKTEDCDNDFYSKNNGTIEISLLFSKGGGAGSQMIKEAVKKSFEMGYEGRVILTADNITKSIGSPIPFYYKMGFKAYCSEKQEYIEKEMKKYKETGIFNQNDEIQMYLGPERIKEYLEE